MPWTTRLSSLLLLLLPFTSTAQRDVADSVIATTSLSISIGGFVPGADLADRFGINAQVGGKFMRKSESNWTYGLNFGYHFAGDVTEPGLMSNLVNDEGHIISNQGRIAEVNVGMRGYYIGLEAGHLFNVVGPNPNSGILVQAGAGYLHHKIRLEHQFHEITQLEEPYLQGYDRLTNGFALNQFVGYFHMSDSRLVNFFVGLDLTQGWTQGRRDLYFDTLEAGDAKRFDTLVGIRGGWVLHFYRRPAKEYFLN